MTQQPTPSAPIVNDAYASVAGAAAELPAAVAQLESIRRILLDGDQDFMAMELRIMIERLKELQDIIVNGDKG